MISNFKLNPNGEAKCFLDDSSKDIEGTLPEEDAGEYNWSMPTMVRPYVCQKAVVMYNITIPRCYLETENEIITLTMRQNIHLCSASSVQVWQANSNCCSRCLCKLPGSALRSTYMLYPSHLALNRVTSGSREGQRNHRGNNINYQSYFSNVWLPLAWYISYSCSCIFWMVNFQIKCHGKNHNVFNIGK